MLIVKALRNFYDVGVGVKTAVFYITSYTSLAIFLLFPLIQLLSQRTYPLFNLPGIDLL